MSSPGNLFELSRGNTTIMASGELLNMLQQGARNGTLLSSCEPEVKELMRQLDVLISQHQREWAEQRDKAKLQLQVREKEIESLRTSLRDKTEQFERLQVVCAQQEQEHKARHADCKAQLVRVRAELSRLRQSYEHLRAKRNQQHQSKHVTGGGMDYKREWQSIRHELKEAKEREREMEKECRQLREMVESRDELTRALEVDQRQSQQNLAYFQETVKNGERHIKELEGKLSASESGQNGLHHLQQELRAKQQLERELRESLRLSKEEGRMLREELTRMKVNTERKESETVHKLEQRLQRLESQLRESKENAQVGHSAAINRFKEQAELLVHSPVTVEGGRGYVALEPVQVMPPTLHSENGDEKWSKLLESVLGKHFDQLDSSLQKILSPS